MPPVKRPILLLLLVIAFSGCAIFSTGYEDPVVKIKSFRLLPSDSMAPQFEIGLHLINPNRDPLKLRGIHYTISLEDHRMVSGVASDLPTIAAYGEDEVTLIGSVDLVSGAKLLHQLLMKPQNSITYTIEAKLDVGRYTPVIRVKEEGQLITGGRN